MSELESIWESLTPREREYLTHIAKVGCHAANERCEAEAESLQAKGLLTAPNDRMFREQTALGRNVFGYSRTVARREGLRSRLRRGGNGRR